MDDYEFMKQDCAGRGSLRDQLGLDSPLECYSALLFESFLRL
jgi:hypothetical protein